MFPRTENDILTDREPHEIVIHDDTLDCPYIDGQVARMPVRLPVRALQPQEFDRRLARGDRRHGVALYAPDCPNCRACEAIRLDLHEFQPGKTHRRILRRGDQTLRVDTGPPLLSQSRVDLYEKHLHGRGLAKADHSDMTLPRYRSFVVDRFCDSFEIRLWLGSNLVGVAITDCGTTALSAHYTFFDPDYPHLSLGTYAILQQVRIARQRAMRYLYLGLFIGQNVHMRYKARFLPHERRIGGAWKRFDAC